MEVRFCPACSHIVSPDYRYCPQCGSPVKEPLDLQTVLDRSLEPLERKEREAAIVRLQDLLETLGSLEEAIEVWLKSSDFHSQAERSKDRLPFCR